MSRTVLLIIWLLLSAWLLIWVGEGLFGVDQRSSILPFGGMPTVIVPVLIGVAWGLMITLGATTGRMLERQKLRGLTQIGVGRIVEAHRTGLTVNDVPQYDLFMRIGAGDGTEFISRIRTLLDPIEQGSVQLGLPLPVRYRVTNHDTAQLADMNDRVVRAAMLEWRIQRGLVHPRLVRARKDGLQVPASILAIRPTGVSREGQTELHLRLLVAPEGQQSWEAETTVFLHPDALSRVQVGSPVWARYLPGDPHTVAMTIEQEAAA